MELLEKVLDDKNLFEAYKQVYKNKGASGVDGITIDELGFYMYQHKEEIKEQIRKRKYKPSPPITYKEKLFIQLISITIIT